MGPNKSRMRSELPNTTELKRQMAKIKANYTAKSSTLVFEKAGVRIKASACTNVALDETLANNNIQFQRPDGVAVENYDLADIRMIKRLRTKKYLVIISDLADDAAV